MENTMLNEIWTTSELLEDIRTVVFRFESSGLSFTFRNLEKLKNRRIKEAMDFNGQNVLISESTILKTISNIIEAFSIYEENYVLA
ncbi:hypothetical protein [Paenibacillus apiarius]|uniref:hypothetical protein n=1 Tax=Paenibacillus apiarius TaxID=46240 RepID=UPI003B3B108B